MWRERGQKIEARGCELFEFGIFLRLLYRSRFGQIFEQLPGEKEQSSS